MLSDLPMPAKNDPLDAAIPSAETLSLLARRRSTKVKDGMTDPAPDDNETAHLLRLAARVPDHRQVAPFRFIVIRGTARARLGEVLADAFQAQEPDAKPHKVDLERARFDRAPLSVAVVSSVDPNHKTPEWEQVLTAGAVCQNLLIAACAAGYAAQWLTEWYAYDARVLEALGLGPHERIAGFIYIGTAPTSPTERPRPDADALTTHFDGTVPAA